MMPIFDLVPLPLFLLSFLVALFAGVVKGTVGFGMPMIMISGLGAIVAPELALAGLILPTLASNGMQALRYGAALARDTVRRFGRFLMIGFGMLLISAQLVSVMPAALVQGGIGALIVVFAAMQLSGWQPRLDGRNRNRAEVICALLAGGVGGISGVWGPPTVMYLTALQTEKHEQIRIQGVIYGLGAVALAISHLGSGILNAQSLPWSASLIPAAVLGMWIGGLVQDRIDQNGFRRLTLLVLLIAGLNLLRRALLG